ncbi:hypothetical protein FNF29_02988 [Cafeteria roenbergensis]|uniref:Purple acid phosphatase n=1 Tax=Cafeteria roenbergensis TaxID=33653 RepID=A0A5A8CNA5_CAFRO|nr:hypothetical protein FNF29_02988 [Cafeteria roenbergensis]|eukprot:KAA0153600.1 hypothetical protein FNF29_02988 [Cafeteria roenbergensis]
MRAFLSLLAVAAAAASARAGKGYENENQFHGRPFTHTDHTAALAAQLGTDNRPVEGFTVASKRALSPDDGSSLEIMTSKYTDLSNGAWLRVRLDFPEAKNSSDAELQTQWIGVFGPSGINASTTTPIKYSLATVDAGYATSGVADINFRVLNMRVPLDIIFFRDCRVPVYTDADRSIHSCNATLRVGPVTFADYDLPYRVSLLRRTDQTTMGVAWTTKTTTTGQKVWLQRVQSETGMPVGDASVFTPKAEQAYTAGDLCDAPAATYGYFNPGVRNVAVLTGLEPGARYNYTIVDAAGANLTSFETFDTPTAAGGDKSASLLVFADLGRGTEDGALTWDDYGRPALNTSRRMREDLDRGIGHDGIFHVGDISYAVGFLSIWDTYGDMMEPLLRRTAYSLNYGNHEADNTAATTPAGRTVTLFNGSDAGGECGVATNGWYPMPWDSIDAPWYSYDVGPVHVVAMGTEHDFRTGSPQHAWIEADLKAVDRSVTPWILFGGHRPMYIDSTYAGPWDSDINVSDMLIEHVEPLLVKYAVDVAVWGHNHVVQRLCKLRGGECVERSSGEGHTYTKGGDGVVHLVIGAAGASFSNNIHHPHLEMTEFGAYVYGHSRMNFESDRRMTWQWIANEGGDVLDFMEIVNTAAPPQPPATPGTGPGTVAAIVGGSVAGIALIAAGFWCYRRHRIAAASAGERAALRDSGDGSHAAPSSPFTRLEDRR